MVVPLLKIVITAVVAVAGMVMAAEVRRRSQQRDRQHENFIYSGPAPRTPRTQDDMKTNNSNICKICDDPLNSKKERELLDCGHRFHQECLKIYRVTRKLNGDSPNVCPLTSCRSVSR